jgi:hypothetical protein
MDKTKSNGQVGHALPAASALQPPPTKTSEPDPFDQVRTLIKKMGDKRYAEGFRRAATIVARAVGQLDGESKGKLSKALDLLEEELHQAEVVAQ